MAEGALRLALGDAVAGWRIDSAGTGNWHAGAPPDPRAIAAAGRHGADIAGLRARQVTGADFERFDLILAMDRQNLAQLERLQPANASARLMLALDWVPGRRGQSVADPYYGDDGGFAQTWADVSAVAAALRAAQIVS